jgi:hypothetical protein
LDLLLQLVGDIFIPSEFLQHVHFDHDLVFHCFGVTLDRVGVCGDGGAEDAESEEGGVG